MFLANGTNIELGNKIFFVNENGVNEELANKAFFVNENGQYELIWSGIKESCTFSKYETGTLTPSSGCDGKNGYVYFLVGNTAIKYNPETDETSTITTGYPLSVTSSIVSANSWKIAENRYLVYFTGNTAINSQYYTGFNVFNTNTESYEYSASDSSTYAESNQPYNRAVYHNDGFAYFCRNGHLIKYSPTTNINTYVGNTYNTSLNLATYNGNLIGYAIDRSSSIVTMYYINTASAVATQYDTIDFSSSAYASTLINLADYRTKQIDDTIYLICSNGMIGIHLDDNTYHDITCSGLSKTIDTYYSAPIYCEELDTLIYQNINGSTIYKFDFR